MSKIYTALKLILKPSLFFAALGANFRLGWIPDRIYLSIIYKGNMQKKLNLDYPVTYNEKLQWLKIHDRRPEYTVFVDKYEVRKYIEKSIGGKYLVPLLGVYNDVEEIFLDELPNEFVLKCTHDSGNVIICKDKKNFDFVASKRKLKKAQKKNHYYAGREWPYKNVKPRIICEKLIKTSDGKPPKDYKIFCFHGEPKFAFVASDRDQNTKFDFFDINWIRQPLKQHYPTSDYVIEKPRQWEKILNLAKTLSQGISHVRVDFYIDSDDQVLFGELTFFHFSGIVEFEPETYDYLLGSWIDLSRVKKYN